MIRVHKGIIFVDFSSTRVAFATSTSVPPESILEDSELSVHRPSFVSINECNRFENAILADSFLHFHMDQAENT